MAGEPMLWPALTGLECLEFLARLRGGVDERYRRSSSSGSTSTRRKKVREYSKGNRQKIQLIAAFSARADLLVLDEPTSGLDPLMEAAFRDTVAEARTAGQTVFLSSHILSEVEALCDRIGILREGRLVEQGTMAELRHLSAHVVEATYDGAPPAIDPPDGVTMSPVGASSLRFDVHGPVGPLLDRLAGHRRHLARQPRADARGDLPRPLRRRRHRCHGRRLDGWFHAAVMSWAAANRAAQGRRERS